MSTKGYNRPVRQLGPYWIKEKIKREKDLEVFEALDPLTGGTILLFRPLAGEPPELDLAGLLPWRGRTEDAWVAEVPFGAVNAARWRGDADPGRLEAWARRLLGVLAALREAGLGHGRLAIEDLWVRGEEVWLAGAGVPWPEPTPDEAALFAVFKELGGENFAAWPRAGLLEALAEGRVSLEEALMAFNEGVGGEEVLKAPEPASSLPPPAPAGPPPTVRVRKKAKKAKAPEPAKPPSPAPSPRSSQEPRPRLEVVEEPEEVIRIGEPTEPAFEVKEPDPGRRAALRVLVYGFAALLLVFLGLAGWRLATGGGAKGQVIRFVVEPEGQVADLFVVEAPEGSKIAPGFLTKVPAEVRLDAEGRWRFRVERPGFSPATFGLEVPVPGGEVRIRLKGQ